MILLGDAGQYSTILWNTAFHWYDIVACCFHGFWQMWQCSPTQAQYATHTLSSPLTCTCIAVYPTYTTMSQALTLHTQCVFELELFNVLCAHTHTRAFLSCSSLCFPHLRDITSYNVLMNEERRRRKWLIFRREFVDFLWTSEPSKVDFYHQLDCKTDFLHCLWWNPVTFAYAPASACKNDTLRGHFQSHKWN